MPVSDEHVLKTFLEGFSPRRYVRSSMWDRRHGTWTNRYPHRTRLERVRAERPVAMHLFPEADGGPRLWGFDLDARPGGADAAQEEVKRLSTVLLGCGLPAVPVVSGPSGGRHLWTACEEPLPDAVLGRLMRACRALAERGPVPDAPLSLRTLDVAPWSNRNTGALRPPGAAHRAGGCARLAEHDLDQAVALLSKGGPLAGFTRLVGLLEDLTGVGPVRSATRRGGAAARAVASGRLLPPSVTSPGTADEPPRRIVIGADGGHPRLAGRRPLAAADLLKLRRRLPAGADRSAHGWAVLLPLALSGRTYAEVEQLAREPVSSPGLEYFRSQRARGARRSRGARELLTRQWELSVERAARLPAGHRLPDPRVTGQVADLLWRMEADTARWARPAGPADAAVLYAVALVALVSGRSEVTLDVRRGSLLTGFSPQTVNVAIRDRLIPDGWLREVAPADPRRRLARTVALAPPCGGPDMVRRPGAVAAGYGSGTSGNAPLKAASRLLSRLRGLVDSVASPLWTTLGHHVQRTLCVVGDAWISVREIQARTGYSRRTVLRHAAVLQESGLPARSRAGYRRTTRTVHQALAAGDYPDVAAERAVIHAIDRQAAQWWQAELRWLRAVRVLKTPRQVLGAPGPLGPELNVYRYPRTAGGRPDHARAWRIAAARSGVMQALRYAYELARRLPSPLERFLRLPGSGAGPDRDERAAQRRQVPPLRSARLVAACSPARPPAGQADPAPSYVTSSTCHSGNVLAACDPFCPFTDLQSVNGQLWISIPKGEECVGTCTASDGPGGVPPQPPGADQARSCGASLRPASPYPRPAP